MTQISRLHSGSMQSGNIINPTHLNNEFNQLVQECNGQDTRISAAEAKITPLQSIGRAVIRGLMVQYNTANRVVVKPGICLDGDGVEAIEVAADLTLDITTSGANGLDTGTESANTWYYVWLIKNTASGMVAGLLSASSSTPVMPAGYTRKRLLPIAVRNDASGNFIDFMVAEGWPSRPKVIYNAASDFTAGTFLNILAGATNTTFAASSLAGLVPPISRMAVLGARALYASAAGIVFMRPTGATHNGWRIASALSSASVHDVPMFEMITDASQSIDRRVSNAGTSFDIDVRGFVITELG